MKSFKAFRLDTANHILWRDGNRVPIAPKAFDVLAYLVGRAGQVVTQDEILEALWPETYVNPEVLRKYILEIRKALGDRAENPEFVETVPKRGYRFIGPVVDDLVEEPLNPAPPRRTEIVPPEGEHSSSARRLWKLALIPILAIVTAAGIATHFRPIRHQMNVSPPNDTSIAVLPFADMSATKDQEYFSDGLSEQLINDLSKISGLRVVARSSAFQFRDKNEDLREVGRKLGVANVLEGSVRRQGNHVRITAELIKADDGFQLWSQTYDRQINDIFAVQDEIAQAATVALQLKLLGGNGRPISPNLHSANPDAYQAYLQAKYFSGRGQSEADLGKALGYVNTAIKLDEKY